MQGGGMHEGETGVAGGMQGGGGCMREKQEELGGCKVRGMHEGETGVAGQMQGGGDA